MSSAFVFTRLYLQRPIPTSSVVELAVRLAASDVAKPLSLEVWATDSGLQYVLGCDRTAVRKVKDLLALIVSGTTFGRATRPPLDSAARVASTRMPLATGETAQVIRALYGVLATRRSGEVLMLQMVLGGVRTPAHVPSKLADPFQPVASRLLRGTATASPDVQRRIRDHVGSVRFLTTIRLGVSGPNPARRRRLIRGMLGSLQSIEAPGAALRLVRDPLHSVELARGSRAPLVLTPDQLVPLLGWPLDDADLPGADPIHPRRLSVPAGISATENVFADSLGAGIARPVGFDTLGRMQHALMLGPTGSGKSALIEHLVLADIAAKRSAIVVEPKRQLVRSILDRVPASAAGDIVIIDASDADPVGFNPCELGADDDPYVVADNVLAALKAIFEDGWGPRTEYLIQGALVTLLLAGLQRDEPYTLIDLPRILTDASLRREAIKYVSDDPALSEFWSDFEEMSPGQRANQIAAPLNKLRKLVMRRNVVAVLGQPRPRFRLRDVFKEGKTVLIPLNEALIGKGSAQLLGSLIVAEIWTATLKRAAEPDPQARPGMVFIDEVQNYLHMPTDVADAMATSRSYGVAWHVAHQFREQLPRQMRAGFDTNARSKFIFALEHDDARDLAKFAPELTAEDFQRLGKYEIYCRLMAGASPTGWFSARTLPPLPAVGAGGLIRETSQRLYGRQAPPARVLEAREPSIREAATTEATPRRGQKARQS